MKKKKAGGICAVLAAVLTLTAGCGNGTDGRLKFGAAGVGGLYYSFVNAYTQIASEENEVFDFNVKATAGSSANLRLLSEDYIDLAVAQADLIDAAYNGTGVFEDTAYTGYQAVAGLYTEACQIVVRGDSEIQTMDDLQGKTISIGEAESGTQINAEQILQLSGLVEPVVTLVNLDYVDAARELKSGEIDAFFCTAGIQASVIEELAKECNIRLISLDDKVTEKLLDAYALYKAYTIPAGTYTGQTEAVQTIGIEAVLLAREELSADTVKELTGLLFAHSEDILYATSLQSLLPAEDAVKGISIPFHKGAKAYYAENGIDISES